MKSSQEEEVKKVFAEYIPQYLNRKVEESIKSRSTDERYVIVFLDDYLMSCIEQACPFALPKSFKSATVSNVQELIGEYFPAEELLIVMRNYLDNLDRKKRCRFKNINSVINSKDPHKNRVFWERF